jgi:uncharacterized protein YprB with RNaseH-like and TPR domain
MDTVADLRRVIRRLEGARPRRPAPEPVESIAGGEVFETPDGALVRVRRTFPWSHRHGRYALVDGCDVTASLLALLARSEEHLLADRRLLFLDIETTGLAGGTGTYAFLVGVGFVEGESFVVEQYFMRDFDEEPALLAALEPLLVRAPAVVTFNGTGFDLPLLETRFVLGRRRWPQIVHVDLLAPARRVWSAALSDCRLPTLERGVLGLARTDDVPGWEIPSRFFAYLRDRAAGRLRPVFAHNLDDVLSLVVLLGWFAKALQGHAPRLSAEEMAGLGRFWERVDAQRSVDWYRGALDAGLDGTFAHWVRLRLAWWEKRRARWDAARDLWEAAIRAEFFDPRPWEELAKFHEHRRRDLTAAYDLVSAALEMARSAPVSARVVDAFVYRRTRLERRRDGGRSPR